MASLDKTSKSIDGQWIRENESIDFDKGIFEGKSLLEIQNIVNNLKSQSSVLLNEVAVYLESDKEDIILKDDSYGITELNKYAETYNKCSKLDFNDYEQLVVAYMGFDLIVNNVPKITEIIRNKFSQDEDYNSPVK